MFSLIIWQLRQRAEIPFHEPIEYSLR